MAPSSTIPSINSTAFACPHCGAFTTQHWHSLLAKEYPADRRTPTIPDAEFADKIRTNPNMPEETRGHLLDWYERMNSGLVGFEILSQGEYVRKEVENLFLTQCFNCKNVAVWVHANLIFPAAAEGPTPNSDLPDDILRDFSEARSILAQSPRGAAALLRLAVQKLCGHLGEKGKNIDDDIASLVKKGLDPLVQQSLDVVRVIGNEAVHPGTIDLRDDQATALRLFDLVNIIAQQMISHPKSVKEMYAKLPDAKRKAIDARDGRSQS